MKFGGNTYSDFFYSNDIARIIEYFIREPSQQYAELNLVYDNKYKFSDIVAIINNLSEHKVDIIIKEGQNKHYTADGSKLKSLNLDLEGLEQGIIKTYNILKHESI